MVKKVIIISLFLSLSAIGRAERIHTVRRGETLWEISGHYLDDHFYWPHIYEANMNQIEDPHWIYPGQEFIIPHPVFEEEETEIASFKASRQFPEHETAPEEETELVEEEEVAAYPGGEEKVGFWQKDSPVVPWSLVYRAGYITKEPPTWGKIIAVEEAATRNRILSHHEVLVDKGARDLVAEGDLFTVLKCGKGVRHPRGRRYLGKIVFALGTLRVISVEERSFRALVEVCYEPFRVGDAVVPFDMVEIPTGKELVETGRDVSGLIVAALGSERKLLPRDIVYIDKGKMDDIHPGDIFEIYREGKKIRGVLEPMRVVGELQVLRVEEETSTAVITSIDNRLDLRVRESIRLRREAI
jgi:hypothetical protein